MKGLLLKEFYGMRWNVVVMFLFCMIISILAVVIENVTVGFRETGVLPVLIIFSTLTLGMIFAATIMNDKKTNWEKFEITSPLSKKQVISSKYIGYFLYSMIGLLSMLFINLLVLQVSNKLDEVMLPYVFDMAGASFIIAFLTGSIIIPASFTFYKVKSSTSAIIIFFTTLISFFLSPALIWIVYKLMQNETSTLIVSSIVSLIIYILSWIIGNNKLKM